MWAKSGLAASAERALSCNEQEASQTLGGWRAFWSRGCALVALATALLLALSLPAHAADVATLIDRLKNGEDFRVRVSAALELGRTKKPEARVPLEQALEDANAAVRAAAAAALKALGDKRAIPALERRQKDESAAVRAQIKATIAALRAPPKSGSDGPKLLIKIGKMKNGKGVLNTRYLPTLEKTSREKFGELPGVALIESAEDPPANGKKKLPMVMVSGQLRRLNTSREGSEIVFSAMVEYIVTRIPEQAILGTVSGSASTKASQSEANDKQKSAELERIVVTAAIESAVRRAPEALAAASK
jgi:hypothetical protein